jgi:DNA-directed RNA polymerase subunit beta
MIRIGAEVKPGDILMELLQKENQILLQKRNCFVQSWDKAGDVKDASLKASPSLHGVVLDKKLSQER